ncbi:Ig-like domain-containing protein, partial [Herbaspirillum sp.]|uniref:Ig-like domain-containing protein n=1 Tax=Herbaspirillum sp. TaxID=1890675 RepID=UPI00258DA292
NTVTMLRNVTLDQTAPSIVTVTPADTLTNIPPALPVTLEFSEEVNSATLNTGTIQIQSSINGAAPQTVNGTITVTDNTAKFIPDPALPDTAVITVTLGTGIQDPAGNALSNPQTVSFTTSDKTAPEAPTVNTLPERTSLHSLTVTGTSEPGAAVSVTGGLNLVQTTSDTGGNFSLEVILKTGGLNQLCFTAADNAGNTGIPQCVQVIQENTQLTVIDASFENNQ